MNCILDVKDYCQDCPDFDPVAIKIYGGNRCVVVNVACSNRERCERLYKHIKKEGIDSAPTDLYQCTNDNKCRYAEYHPETRFYKCCAPQKARCLCAKPVRK